MKQVICNWQDVCFTIQYEESCADAVRFATQHCVCRDTQISSDPTVNNARFSFAKRGEQWVVSCSAGLDDSEPSVHRGVELAMDALSALVTRYGIHQTRVGPTFHAAAVSTPAKQSVVIPGVCGAGKSTLAAYLWLEHDYKLLSDEAVMLGANSTVTPWLRPLHIKPGAINFAKRWQLLDRDDAECWASDGHYWLRATEIFNVNDTQISAIVLPTFDARSNPEISKLRPAAAVQQMLRFMVNHFDYSGQKTAVDGMRTLAALLEQVPAYTIRYNSLDSLASIWSTIEQECEI